MKKVTNLKDFLKSFPVISRVPVQWGDMDSFAHVNNTVYFKYQEAARLKFMDMLMKNIDTTKFDVDSYLKASNVGPILADTYCKFKYPLKYPFCTIIARKYPCYSIAMSLIKFLMSTSQNQCRMSRLM